MRAIFELFLIPAGRIGRAKFGFGLAGFIGFIYGMNGLMRAATPQSAFEFWLGLTYVFLFFYMLYCIYGKRLHDMGRTFWPLTACITLSFLIMIAVIMQFGGSEYFSEFAQYDRKDTIDPARREAITQAYEARLRDGEAVIGPILALLWGGFTLWLGLAKPFK